jgi:hypothetical protein
MKHAEKRRSALKKIAVGSVIVGSGSVAYASSDKFIKTKTNQADQFML